MEGRLAYRNADEDVAPANVLVTLRNPATGFIPASTCSGSDGSFRFINPPAGDFPSPRAFPNASRSTSSTLTLKR